MMLDNKNHQKWPLTVRTTEDGSGVISFAQNPGHSFARREEVRTKKEAALCQAASWRKAILSILYCGNRSDCFAYNT